MRACLIALAVLIWPPLARAGLYIDNPAVEPASSVPPEKIRDTVLYLRGAAVAPPPGEKLDNFSPRAIYLRQAEQLEARRKAGTLSPIDRANLGGCLIRLGRVPDAISVLRGGPDHFLVTANLATAYFLGGDLTQAMQAQRYLLKTWPNVWAGWTTAQWSWYRQCEHNFLRLLELREQEKRAGPRSGPQDIDRLFPKVRFVAEDGTYKAGALARESADELPARAIDTVLQLCIWLPGDLRLFWLLGELLNAVGQVDRAYDVLDTFVAPFRGKIQTAPGQLSWAPNQFKGLEAHHAVLARARPIMKMLRELDLFAYLLCTGRAVPMPNLAPGAAGPAAQAAAAWALVVELPSLKQRLKDQERQGLSQPQQPPPPEGYTPQSPLMAFTWRHLAVSFGFGALAMMLVGLQWREWQRRRAARRLAEPPEAEEVVAAGDERVAGPQAPGPS